MRLGVLGLCFVATAIPLSAEAQLVVAPPVLSKNVSQWKKPIGGTLLKGIDERKLDRIKLTKQKGNALKKCKNTLSCLAEVGQGYGASHVLHTIVGRKGDKVRAQLTVIAVSSSKPVAQVKVTAKANKKAIIAAIDDGVRQIAEQLESVAPFGLPLVAPPPMVAQAQPSPTVAPPPPVEPEPVPPAAAEPAPIAAAPKVEAPSPVRTRAEPGLMAATTVDKQPNWIAWGLVGGGGGMFLGGIISLGLAKASINERNDTAQVEADRRQELTDQAARRQNAGVTLIVLGTATAATGVVFELMGIGAPKATWANVELSPAPSGVTLTW